jgi:hypothetical protein
MDTTLYPLASRPGMSPQNYSHSPKDLLKGLMGSLNSQSAEDRYAEYVVPTWAGPIESVRSDAARSTSCIRKADLSAAESVITCPGRWQRHASSARMMSESNQLFTKVFTTRPIVPLTRICFPAYANTRSLCIASIPLQVVS